MKKIVSNSGKILLLFFTCTNFAMQINPEKTRQLQRLLSTSTISEARGQIVDLLTAGADANAIIFPKFKETPLHLAAAYDKYNSTVEALLQHNASHQLTNFNNVTPLYIACINGAVKNVTLLMAAGASLKDMLQQNKAQNVKPVLESLLYACRTVKLELGHVPSGYLETAKMILLAEGRMPIFSENGLIARTHTPTELAKTLELDEFNSVFQAVK